MLLAITKDTGRTPTFSVFNGSSESRLLASETLPLGEWVHGAATLSGTTGTFYINGQAKGTNSNMHIPNGTTLSNAYIGKSNWSGDGYADIGVDELRIWNYARSQSKISTYKDSQLTGDESGLVAYYRFDIPNSTGNSVEVEVADDGILPLQAEYENASTGQADISLSWSKSNSFTTSYYDSTDWSGDAAATVIEDAINHNWGAGNPGDGEYGITDGTFSAEWEGTFEFFDASDYLILLTTDDSNVALYVNDTLISLTSTSDGYYGLVTLAAGNHDIKVKYSHTIGDAVMQLDWASANTFISDYVIDDWYWSDDISDLTGVSSPSKLSATVPVDFGWGLNEGVSRVTEHSDGSLSAVLHSDGFSIGLRGMFEFDEADYDFIFRVDDGVTFRVDGVEYLGHWEVLDMAKAYIVSIPMTAGYHFIEVEYYEVIDYAVLELDWSKKKMVVGSLQIKREPRPKPVLLVIPLSVAGD